MLSPLLSTKFHLPPARLDRVPRPRLVEALNNALRAGHSLILIAAPAGFGKTTLVADWLSTLTSISPLPLGEPAPATPRGPSGAGARVRAAWLSLDKDDNDPALFWRYVVAALQTVDETLGRGVQAALEMPLQAPQPLPLESLVAALINDLTAVATPITLVLDDYHVIDAELIHASLNYFLDHLPPHVRLVIATRVDPPLALSRRRSRAQLTEARTPDLRFTVAEAGEFLNTLMGLDLPAEDVASLENRTEGWIAGLQLAALSLRQQADRHAFVTTFAGDDRYVADYLLEEILHHQPPHIQTFLLQTSIVERLCGPLCEALTGEANSQAILTFLEQANLFVVPLDNRRFWYRYHHLFADLLRRRLRQALETPAWTALYRRASEWYEREGLIAEAVSQALAAPDFEHVADLLERHVLTVFFRSETMLVHNWLKALPEVVLRDRPLLCAMYANTIAHAGFFQPEALVPTAGWLQKAEQALAAAPPGRNVPPSADQPGYDLVRSFVALSHAYLATWRRAAPQTVIELTLHALAGLPPADEAHIDPNYLRLRSGLNNNLGLSYLALGDEEAAIGAFAQARRIGEACGDLLNTYAAIVNQAYILRRHGRLPEAAALCREAFDAVGEAGQRIPYVGLIYGVLGQILLEWNDLPAAEQALVKGLELSQLVAGAHTQTTGRVALAYLQQARGEAGAALETLNQAEQSLPSAATYIAVYRVRLWLMQGMLESATRWAQGRQFADAREAEALTLARVLIARRRAAPSADLGPLLQFLESQLQSAEAGDWTERTIELLILQALARQAQSDVAGALASLQRALALAQPGGYVRLFVDEGQPMRWLLTRLKHTDGEMAGYIGKLLAAGGETGELHPMPARASSGPQPLVEPLTARELEVLRLLAAGDSNVEIAHKLVITLNTTKKHVTHIFEKLGVTNRADAAVRARELGLME
jgi:LuxR family maltose regulon positive regulatory protein